MHGSATTSALSCGKANHNPRIAYAYMLLGMLPHALCTCIGTGTSAPAHQRRHGIPFGFGQLTQYYGGYTSSLFRCDALIAKKACDAERLLRNNSHVVHAARMHAVTVPSLHHTTVSPPLPRQA